ncbi:MAG: hypothetical protein WEE03_10350 [Chloroflexota bacterium]|nr:hypothetical protein [Candidatus Limnocylindria bacterium]
MEILIALFLGVALAVVALGFLAIGAYGRGYEEAEMRRHQWRTELLLRRRAQLRSAA